jgi:hypothetical protein
MFEKIGNSWELIKASAAVLRADKELIVFPIVSAIGVVVVTISFAFPMLLAGFFDELLAGRSHVFGFVVGFAFYVVQYMVIIFANSALVGAAMIRLRGGDPTAGDGFRIAMQRLGSILGYALISATVGMILRWISERGKTLGQIVSSILGLAWNLATYLVVPVLVVEGVGPVEAIKRSANLLKKTWGEQIVGNFGIGLVFGLLMVVVLLVSIAAIVMAVSTGSGALIALVVLVSVLVLVLMGLISSTLNGIYTAAVYRYAAEGEASGFFREELVRGAFRPK